MFVVNLIFGISTFGIIMVKTCDFVTKQWLILKKLLYDFSCLKAISTHFLCKLSLYLHCTRHHHTIKINIHKVCDNITLIKTNWTYWTDKKCSEPKFHVYSIIFVNFPDG